MARINSNPSSQNTFGAKNVQLRSSKGASKESIKSAFEIDEDPMAKLKEAQQMLRSQRDGGSGRSSKVKLQISTSSNKVVDVAKLSKPNSGRGSKEVLREDLAAFNVDKSPRSNDGSAMSVREQEEEARRRAIMNMKLNFTDSDDEDTHLKGKDIEARVDDENVKVVLPWYTFDHSSKPRNIWDLFIIALALWNCIWIPFEVAFKPPKSNQMFVADRIIDILFVVDIVVNFMTTYVNPKTNTDVTDSKRIVKNYVFGGRFWIDLLASIPFDLLIVSEEPSADEEA